jgi:hypothetical protein
LRDFDSVARREPAHFSFKNSDAFRATVELLAFLEQSLVTDANAKERFPALDLRSNFRQQILFLEGIQTIVECTDSWQDDSGIVGQLFRARDQMNVGPHFAQGFFNTPNISRTVINQGDHN